MTQFAELPDRVLADALWDALADPLGMVDSRGASEYRRRLLGHSHGAALEDDDEGPESQVAEWAAAVRYLLAALERQAAS
jgi:hypothetical protein